MLNDVQLRIIKLAAAAARYRLAHLDMELLREDVSPQRIDEIVENLEREVNNLRYLVSEVRNQLVSRR